MTSNFECRKEFIIFADKNDMFISDSKIGSHKFDRFFTHNTVFQCYLVLLKISASLPMSTFVLYIIRVVAVVTCLFRK